MKKILIFALLVIFAAPLGGCNTAEGFGRDLESAGKNIQKSV